MKATKQETARSLYAVSRLQPYRHPELVSGSVSGQGQENARGKTQVKVRGETQVKARGEMLKQVQHDFIMRQFRPPPVILNSFNFVQFANARHTQASMALLSLNRKFQDL